MTRKELIAQCKYYRDSDSPFGNDVGRFAEFERLERDWVYCGGDINNDDRLEYEGCGGKVYDNIPYGILLRLFNRWRYWLDTGDINDFYKQVESYLSNAIFH